MQLNFLPLIIIHNEVICLLNINCKLDEQNKKKRQKSVWKSDYVNHRTDRQNLAYYHNTTNCTFPTAIIYEQILTKGSHNFIYQVAMVLVYTFLVLCTYLNIVTLPE